MLGDEVILNHTLQYNEAMSILWTLELRTSRFRKRNSGFHRRFTNCRHNSIILVPRVEFSPLREMAFLRSRPAAVAFDAPRIAMP